MCGNSHLLHVYIPLIFNMQVAHNEDHSVVVLIVLLTCTVHAVSLNMYQKVW